MLLIGAADARADNVTVGLFAPSAPFPSTSARVELATKLGEHIGKALGGSGAGRVYARSGDFAAAVKKGEVTVALVDATYLASTSNWTVLAASTRGGDVVQGWQVIAKGGVKRFVELRGKRVLVPANGGHEADFALNVLLGGLEKDFLKVEAAPDTVSALAAVQIGKADAAIVPVGVELPSGTVQVLTLPSISTPLLVAYGLTPQQRTTVIAAAASFKGDATVAGFRGGDAEAARSIARRFTAPVKRGPLVVPSVRLVVGDLVEGRKLAIERTPAATFAISR